jgi:hypothetical protein
MLRLLGKLIDDALLIVLLVATVGHIAAFMQTYEEPAFRWAAWLQAIGIDLATLRASYLYKFYRSGNARSIALVAVVAFGSVSFVLNMAYYIRAGAQTLVAVPMAIFFPVAITILSYLRGAQDILDEQRDRRLAARTGGQVVQALDGIGQMGATDRMALQERVRHLRSRGLTMREISAETGVPKSTISIWLRKQTEGNDGAAAR